LKDEHFHAGGVIGNFTRAEKEVLEQMSYAKNNVLCQHNTGENEIA
jgi:hypothetical protein